MDAAKLIGELKGAQARHAKSSLQVSDGTAFDYGRVVGFNLGLQAALDQLDLLLNEDKAKEGRL